MRAGVAGGGGGVLYQQPADTRRTVEQLATAIRTAFIERVGAIGAEGILQRTDERATLVGGQIDAAAFAVGAHLEHGGEIATGVRGGKWRLRPKREGRCRYRRACICSRRVAADTHTSQAAMKPEHAASEDRSRQAAV